jgi:hypothetical protein
LRLPPPVPGCATALPGVTGAPVEAAADLTGTATSAAAAGAGARLSTETARPYTPTAGRETVAGTYRQRLTLTSGRFAMIDNGLGFALVL